MMQITVKGHGVNQNVSQMDMMEGGQYEAMDMLRWGQHRAMDMMERAKGQSKCSARMDSQL